MSNLNAMLASARALQKMHLEVRRDVARRQAMIRASEAREARIAAAKADAEAYRTGAELHRKIVAAVAAVATPTIARAVERDRRVVRLCNKPEAHEVLDQLVWAPAQPEKINSTLSDIFGHGGVLDQIS